MAKSPQPLINGHRYGWSSISLSALGADTPGFVAFSYKFTSDPGKVRAKGSRVIGRTEGEDDIESSIELLKSDALVLIKALGPGWMKKSFDLKAEFGEEAEGEPIVVELFGCRITSADASHSKGTDALTEKFDLHVLDATVNGVSPFEEE
jgi:hypothetical protein